MPVVIGNDTITGISVGGLPSSSVVTNDIADNTIPFSVFSTLMANSKSTNGYTYFPSGLIMQWGFRATGAVTSGTLSFNITFPNECLNAEACEQAINDTGGITSDSFVWRSNPTTSTIGFSIVSGRAGFFWIATGY
jgi:hypothetical protein